MCRSTDYRSFIDRDSLKIKGFFVRFTGLGSGAEIPDSLTLLYPARIDEADFELDGSKLRPDSAAYVTLHRLVKEAGGETVYGSRERVRAGEGVRFEVYMREERVIKGVYRKDEEEDDDDRWKLECQCDMEGEGFADVAVAVEGSVAAITERVKMVRRRRRRHSRKGGLGCLEQIPEVGKEVERESTCCCTCGRVESDGGDTSEGEEEGTVEIETEEGVGWAVDLGIWVMCLGVGYLVSRASSKSLRRGRRRTGII